MRYVLVGGVARWRAAALWRRPGAGRADGRGLSGPGRGAGGPGFAGGTARVAPGALGNTPVAPRMRRGERRKFAAVRTACAPVSDGALPAQYRGALYDCAARGPALAAAR